MLECTAIAPHFIRSISASLKYSGVFAFVYGRLMGHQTTYDEPFFLVGFLLLFVCLGVGGYQNTEDYFCLSGLKVSESSKFSGLPTFLIHNNFWPI